MTHPAHIPASASWQVITRDSLRDEAADHLDRLVILLASRFDDDSAVAGTASPAGLSPACGLRQLERLDHFSHAGSTCRV